MKNQSSSNKHTKEKASQTPNKSKNIQDIIQASSNLQKREINPIYSPKIQSKKKILSKKKIQKKKEEKIYKIIKKQELVKIVKRVDKIINSLKKHKKICFYKKIKNIYEKNFNLPLNLTDIIHILDLEKNNLYVINYKYDKHTREKELIINLKSQKGEIKHFLSNNEILKREEIFSEVYLKYLLENNYFSENQKITNFFKIDKKKIRKGKKMAEEHFIKKELEFTTRLIEEFFRRENEKKNIDGEKKKMEEEINEKVPDYIEDRGENFKSEKKKKLSLEEENSSGKKRKKFEFDFEEKENNKKVTDFFKKKSKKDLILVELPEKNNNENPEIILIKKNRKEILTHLTKIINYYFQMNKKILHKKLTTVLNYLKANLHILKKKEIDYYFDILVDMKFLEIYKVHDKKFNYVKINDKININQIIRIIEDNN